MFFWLIPLVFFPIGSFSVFIGYAEIIDSIDSEYLQMMCGIFLFASCICCFAYFLAREIALYAYNSYDDLVKKITPLLDEGERFITYCFVKSNSHHIPSWMEGSKLLSFVVFTTDRAIIINLSIDNGGVVHEYLENGLFDSYALHSIYSADLLNPNGVRIHGFVSVILMFGFKNLTILPIGETEPFSWLLSNSSTRNGKLIKEINQRRNDYFKQSFTV